ncbi:hypothetical protein N9P38_01475 [Flavobacteriales bacterium]|nr:hypothetical protein [Flavobacteriales bacterium]
MKKAYFTLLIILGFYTSTLLSQGNIGLYTGLDVATFNLMEATTYEEENYGYERRESSESYSFLQSKIGFIYEDIFGDRIALNYAAEYSFNSYKKFEREAFNNSTSKVFLIPTQEKFQGVKFIFGFDFSVYGYMQEDPLQIMINAVFIQQFTHYMVQTDQSNIKSIDYSAKSFIYNQLQQHDVIRELDFGSFIAIGPKVNYEVSDDYYVYGSAKYNYNLVEGDGSNIMGNGFIYNFGMKYMLF